MNFMPSHLSKLAVLVIFLFGNFTTNAQKTVYIPSFITNTGMDLNDNSSQWSYARSLETDDMVIFWEPGFGADPSAAPSPYAIDMEALVQVSQKSFDMFVDSLKFAIKGSSVTDRYKLMIFLLYTTDWAAFGSGQDDLVGSLFVSPAAANIKHVVAHEIGHCFQYITGCDTDGGFRYGFGENGAGGNGFWEQCAQWKAYKVYPELQFTDGDFNEYIKNNHLHIIHENPRYANYFLPDYWTYKRGIDFMGRLWRDARFPEDPVEAYQRLNDIDQETFNNEMYDHAARLTTWDLPALKSYGQDHINKRAQVKMNLVADDYWQIDPSVCIENYGYNSIKLVVPTTETEVKVTFKGLAGENGFRAINVDQAGWKFGFVALLNDGTRIYSDIGDAKYANGSNPQTELKFVCPENCSNLWLVVSGSPQQYWRHEWDDDSSNDEQWPYQVKFENTNLFGKSFGPLKDMELTHEIIMQPRSSYDPETITLNTTLIEQAFALPASEISQYLGNEIKYYAINPDGTLDGNSTAFYPGHWFDDNGKVTNWGNNSYIYSELNINDLSARIGQYPDVCQNGDEFTIRQALIYKRSETDTARLTMTFHVTIKDETSSIQDNGSPKKLNIFPNPTSNTISWNTEDNYILIDIRGVQLVNGYGNALDLTDFASGLYLFKIGNEVVKVVRE
ncbi:MAG TPA: DUF6055 domain-containing protein [Saprospiraceae bacterium]|nr:DUF6055 domain-containing protein [Saprospiraceae bacterium]